MLEVCEQRAREEDLTEALELAKRRDADAIREIHEICRPIVRGVAARFGRRARMDNVGFDDLEQEAAKDLLELVREFNPTRATAFLPYLQSNLRWRIANYLWSEERRMGRVAWGVDPNSIERPEPAWPSPDLSNFPLGRAIRRLSPSQRMVVVRIYWEERTTEDVASELGITVQAVSALRLRAERAIRADLSH